MAQPDATANIARKDKYIRDIVPIAAINGIASSVNPKVGVNGKILTRFYPVPREKSLNLDLGNYLNDISTDGVSLATMGSIPTRLKAARDVPEPIKSSFEELVGSAMLNPRAERRQQLTAIQNELNSIVADVADGPPTRTESGSDVRPTNRPPAEDPPRLDGQPDPSD